jgi:hypothetical protein
MNLFSFTPFRIFLLLCFMAGLAVLFYTNYGKQPMPGRSVQSIFTNQEHPPVDPEKPSSSEKQSAGHQETGSAPFYLGGIQVHETDQKKWVSTLKSSGMNSVEITVYGKQGDWDSDHFWFDLKDTSIITEIRAAKQAGLYVHLILRVSLQDRFPRNRFLWHGMIMPRNEKLRAWFTNYRNFVYFWTKIAEREKVDVLGIGSELNALSATKPIKSIPDLYRYFGDLERQNAHEKRALDYEQQLREQDLWVRGLGNYPSLNALLDDKIHAKLAWARQATFSGKSNQLQRLNERRSIIRDYWDYIIQEVRAHYSGQLTYAANYDNFHEVSFWDQLDLIGINAYFPLRQYTDRFSTDQELQTLLEQGWKDAFFQINRFRAAHQLLHKPLLFTELGYTYRKNTTLEPWQSVGFSILGNPEEENLIAWKHQPDWPKERALAVRALHTVVQQQTINLQGILYWKLTTQNAHLQIEPFALHLNLQQPDELHRALVNLAKSRSG